MNLVRVGKSQKKHFSKVLGNQEAEYRTHALSKLVLPAVLFPTGSVARNLVGILQNKMNRGVRP